MPIIQKAERRYTAPQIHKLLNEYRQRALLLKISSIKDKAELFKRPERLDQTLNSLGGF